MPSAAADLARRLARDAEAVCRHYLSHGRREGRYWLVGDVDNTPGRSLYVRLRGPEAGKGAAGKWTDAATGEHGDLLDLIAANRRLDGVAAALDEARIFLSLPQSEHDDLPRDSAPTGSPEAARRLFASSKLLAGTVAETYLRKRGLTEVRHCTALRLHPRCFYRASADDAANVPTAWPAMVAAVTDLGGTITGAHRTWLDPASSGKAQVATPRRAMGHLLGNGVRFGTAADVMTAGEGIETTLSLRTIMPRLPAVAALSANHLAALTLPTMLRRLYIAQDNDPAGHRAAALLAKRAEQVGIEALLLTPANGDFNDDLQRLGPAALSAHIRVQLAPEDVDRFLLLRDQDDSRS